MVGRSPEAARQLAPGSPTGQGADIPEPDPARHASARSSTPSSAPPAAATSTPSSRCSIRMSSYAPITGRRPAREVFRGAPDVAGQSRAIPGERCARPWSTARPERDRRRRPTVRRHGLHGSRRQDRRDRRDRRPGAGRTDRRGRTPRSLLGASATDRAEAPTCAGRSVTPIWNTGPAHWGRTSPPRSSANGRVCVPP